MEKKPSTTDNEDFLDDELLDDDLDNDPLLAEAAQLLGVPLPPKKTNEKPSSETKEDIEPPKLEAKPKTKTSKNKPKIDKQTVTEFANFLVRKEKIYEEMSFTTILRKIPKEWNYEQEILIDILEILISNRTIKSFSMKITANSVKFYPLESKLKK